MELTEDRRTQLDGIVNQMIQNKESDENIQIVVNDFKSKYGAEIAFSETEKEQPWWVGPAKTTAETLGLMGGGAIGAPLGPVGALGGAALGYAGMKGLAERGIGWLTGESPERSPWLSSGEDILRGGATWAGGEVLGPTLSWLGGKTKGAEKIIEKGIEKGIRPSVVGKGTSPLYKQYMERAKEAVNTIVNYKDSLVLTDEVGEKVVGELPKNLKQFGEAIDQVKRKIFEQYNTMAQQAGGTITGQVGNAQVAVNLWVDLVPISQELNIIARKKILNDLSPEIANYAREKVINLGSRKIYTTEEAQEAIAHLNNSLQAFYKNPSYQNASKAEIDAMIANRLRFGLDQLIEMAVGPGYQGLKNTYGALKTIEKDVVHRAVVDARKNIKGLIDFSDIFSAGDVISGIVGMNPSRIAKGTLQKVLASTYRFMNDPNHIISSMFENVTKVGQPRISQETGRWIGRTIGLTPQMEP